MEITNGSGGAITSAGVDVRNRLLAYSTSRNESVFFNSVGQAYCSYINVTPQNGATTFLSLGNNQTRSPYLVVDFLNLRAANAEVIDILIGPYASPTVSGSVSPVIVPKRANGGAFTSIADIQVGTSLSNLSSQLTVIDSFALSSNTASLSYAPPSGIILPTGFALVLRSTSGNIALKGAIHFYLYDGTQVGTWTE
jgi:hypothetical protein